VCPNCRHAYTSPEALAIYNNVAHPALVAAQQQAPPTAPIPIPANPNPQRTRQILRLPSLPGSSTGFWLARVAANPDGNRPSCAMCLTRPCFVHDAS
jgi:hypothetical protein